MLTRMRRSERTRMPPPRCTLIYCATCALTTRHQQYVDDRTPVCVRCVRRRNMRSVDLWKNNDGSWTGRIFSTRYTGRYEEVLAWLIANNEAIPPHNGAPSRGCS